MSARLLLLAVLLAVLAAPAAAPTRSATSRSTGSTSSVSADRVDVRYVLDQAEIPTFQERGVAARGVLAAQAAEALRGLRVEVDGRAGPAARPAGRGSSSAPGQGGLPTTRVELR